MTFCGIDVGTQGVRAVVVEADGTVVGSGAVALPVAERRDGVRHEQRPDAWWQALCAATSAAVSGNEPVEAIALDATSGTVLVEESDGQPVGPALMYDDGRAAREATEAARIGASLWASLGYRMQPAWALPKVLWLQRHGAVGTGHRVVHQSDHLVRRLVGHPVDTDTSNALKTGADLRTVTWPSEIFDQLALPTESLPSLVLPGTPLGSVSPDASAATGLPIGAVVRAGMTDGCASQIAAGALGTGKWSTALGTTLVVKGSTPELLHDPTGAVYCHRHPDGGWLPGGASSSGAGIIADRLPNADLDALTREAASRPPSSNLTYSLRGTGERFPFVAPEAHAFERQAPRDDAERFAQICQSVSFVERLAYEQLSLLGAPISGPISLTGGATRNDWWNQLRTDILGLPTTLPRSSEAAFGMAILAAAQTGRLTATAHRMVHPGRSYQPDADRHEQFEPIYRSFVEELHRRGWLTTIPKGLHA